MGSAAGPGLGVLITQCLQNDFVKPLAPYTPLPNLLHVGHDEARRLMGDDPAEGPVARSGFSEPVSGSVSGRLCPMIGRVSLISGPAYGPAPPARPAPAAFACNTLSTELLTRCNGLRDLRTACYKDTRPGEGPQPSTAGAVDRISTGSRKPAA